MALAGGVLLYLGHTIPGTILCCLAGLLLLLGLFAPSVQNTLLELGEQLAKVLVTALSALLLTLLYYTLFLAGSLWLRIRSVDPLNRRVPRNGQSNWLDRVGHGADKALYQKQFSAPHSQRGSAR
jgi:hypothetical protein